MKLSNKILIGFFGLSFLYMILAFTEMGFKGDLNRFTDTNSISESVDIENVTYLVLSNLDQRITIKMSDTSRIEIKSITGDLLKDLQYEIVRDTLTMKPMNLQEDQLVTVTIYVSQAIFSGFTNNHTGVLISGLELKTLDIVQTDGWIRMIGSNKLHKIKLEADHTAYFKIENGEIDTLQVTMSDSELLVDPPIKLVKGTMDTDSYLYLRGTDEIQFKKDKSSRLILN